MARSPRTSSSRPSRRRPGSAGIRQSARSRRRFKRWRTGSTQGRPETSPPRSRTPSPHTWARRPRPSGSASTNSCVGWRSGRAWIWRRRFVTPGRVRAATDADEGRRAIDAVLETLAMRIAGARSTTCGRDCRRVPPRPRAAVTEAHAAATERASEQSSRPPRVRGAAHRPRSGGRAGVLDVISQLPAEYEALVRR